ncbi:MAG: YjbQ family protein [Armatimonadetes bacterium]|nr:YjbQ family protein [Armatimonadota bacterium]
MGTRWQTIALTSKKKTDLLDITEAVSGACQKAGATEGLVVVYCPHTTAGVLIQEAEPGLLRDLEGWLSRVVPPDEAYHHNRIDDNAASHLRAVLSGASVVVPLRGGRPALGTWQRVLFVELDGPRERGVHVGVIA